MCYQGMATFQGADGGGYPFSPIHKGPHPVRSRLGSQVSTQWATGIPRARIEDDARMSLGPFSFCRPSPNRKYPQLYEPFLLIQQRLVTLQHSLAIIISQFSSITFTVSRIIILYNHLQQLLGLCPFQPSLNWLAYLIRT